LTARQSVLSYYEEQDTLPMPTEEELADPAATLSELKESGDAPQELLDIWESYADADEAVEDANLALSQISSDSLDTAQDKVDTLTGQIDSLQAEIDKLIATFGSAGLQAALEAKNAAKDALDTAEDAYLTAEQALNDKMAADNKSAALLGLDLADLQAQIQKQKNLIAELSGGEDNQIVANVSGTVQSVEVTAGSKPQKDTVLCTIDVPDQGYTLSFSVSNDQARRLRPGDTATVTNYYWGSQIVATLESIKTDPKNPQTNKLLTFTLEGDVSAGSQLTISVGSRSASYDSIVPNSAIRSDANGSFVFKVEAKNSPLGNRYIARRVSVEVLASDDTNSAVTGDFGWGDYVITTSSAPIQNGDLVRLAD
ncbi:MAG: HlyD family efflux transporter periplasmic adaptor subunit, partial [Oscillospiraceae bacterium]|nr:HlyD family efflux transporter periplasmic adaptor subunit [Oscillospiraceae bacterium]